MRRLFFALIITTMLFGAVHLQGQTEQQLIATQDTKLKEFLQDYVKNPPYDDKDSRYLSAFVHLKNGGEQQAIVYLLDQNYCGSGGCTTLILTPEGSSYKILTSITIVKLPIRVLTSESNGWHDIAVQVQGGGILHAYEAKLPFNGKTCPHNPTVPPARRLSNKPEGKVVVSWDAKATPLF